MGSDRGPFTINSIDFERGLNFNYLGDSDSRTSQQTADSRQLEQAGSCGISPSGRRPNARAAGAGRTGGSGRRAAPRGAAEGVAARAGGLAGGGGAERFRVPASVRDSKLGSCWRGRCGGVGSGKARWAIGPSGRVWIGEGETL